MSYAIITVGGKQYRVREGERLLVDRLKTDEGKTFSPTLLMLGGNGDADFDSNSTVTARVVGHVLGDKIRIGKYKKRTGYKRHNGFARTSRRSRSSRSVPKAAPQRRSRRPRRSPPRRSRRLLRRPLQRRTPPPRPRACRRTMRR